MPAPSRSPGRRALPRTIVEAADRSKIMGIKAGDRTDHPFVGVWPVVVEGRLFARSWTIKPDGWCRTFRDDPLGVIQVGDRTVRVRALAVRSARLLDAIEAAYAAKYPTPASRKYVRGFRTERRRATTTEFVRR
jgi:hypothetical protein